MNCFEWQSRSSDYLDGTLIGPQKKEADEHIDSCKECSEKYKHYRLILTSIASQPRSTLPVPIRKSPFSATLPRIDLQRSRSRWERTPWFIRTGAEGVGIAFIILFIVAMVPRVRSLYEKSIERRLDAFSVADLSLDNEAAKESGAGPAVPLARGKTYKPTEGESQDTSAPGDEFSGENEDDEDSAAGAGTDGNDSVHVGSSEIWRFSIKTDSPHEIRPKVVQLLTDLGVSAQTPGVGGTEAPGGIQFDLLVPQGIVANLKHQLQKIAPSPASVHDANASEASEMATRETFTWYKNKSKRKIPAGKARVVIWLSQM
jgi:hypothetical protein